MGCRARSCWLRHRSGMLITQRFDDSGFRSVADDRSLFQNDQAVNKFCHGATVGTHNQCPPVLDIGFQAADQRRFKTTIHGA